jgi:hypothetical protein
MRLDYKIQNSSKEQKRQILLAILNSNDKYTLTNTHLLCIKDNLSNETIKKIEDILKTGF